MSNPSGRAVARRHQPKTKPKSQKVRRALVSPPPGYEACTIAQFCTLYGISPSYYWKLQALGIGPRVLKLGGRRFITRQAANDWLRAMEVESERAAAAAASGGGQGRQARGRGNHRIRKPALWARERRPGFNRGIWVVAAPPLASVSRPRQPFAPAPPQRSRNMREKVFPGRQTVRSGERLRVNSAVGPPIGASSFRLKVLSPRGSATMPDGSRRSTALAPRARPLPRPIRGGATRSTLSSSARSSRGSAPACHSRLSTAARMRSR